MTSAAALSALVLNADYRPLSAFPLSTWSFEKTMRKVMTDRVVVVSEYDVTLRSARLEYRPPSVVALKRYVQRPENVGPSREAIWLRDDGRCQYCDRALSLREFTFDHVTPRCRGGKSTADNLVVCCVSCNQAKGSSMSMKPLRQPYQPTEQELARKKRQGKGAVHTTWLDFMYWMEELDP